MKKNIALLIGGYSGEFEISMQSARVIESNLDRELFNVYPLLVTREGWFFDPAGNKVAADLNDFSLLLDGVKVHFDGAFIGIHGTPGEDGILQAYLDLKGVKYNTCGRTTSSMTFNKYFSDEFVRSFGNPVAKTVYLHKRDQLKTDVESIEREVGLPAFVKPNNSGSSVGINKAYTTQELTVAIGKAFAVDDEVLVQEYVPGREITCGIYEKEGEMVILPLTEIVSKKDFFDLEAKYDAKLADEITPAPISEELAAICRTVSADLYRKFNCRGVVRFDYILTEKYGKPEFYFLEVNTIPGLTEASLVPKMVIFSGSNLKEFFTSLMTETLERY